MAKRMTFDSGAGASLHGALAMPAAAGRAGGVVVVQEWWGLSPFIELVCDRLAEAGFMALAPDLYHGKQPASKAEAAQAMGALDNAQAVAEIGRAVAHLKADARCNGKVAVTGFCLGGALTLAAACKIKGLAAAVPFYGIPELPLDAYAHAKVPIQAHFAKKDDWAKASVAEQIQKAVRSGGGAMDLFVYDSVHAFMRSTDPEVYDADNTRVAWDRAVHFLKQHLG